eukprot:9149095-Ditylum_brightwellii.AAC.1
MEHHGVCRGDGKYGNGARIMKQISWKIFNKYTSENCPQPGIGMIFLPCNPERHTAIKEMIEDGCKRNKLGFLGWGEVPRIFITTVIIVTIITKIRTKFLEDASAHVTR